MKLLLASLLLLSCRGGPEETGEVEATVPLDAPRLLRRMSLDLRGVLPSLDELDRVAADPDALDLLRDDFLDDPRFEERLVSFFAERFKTRLDAFEVRYYDYGLPAEEECRFERSVGEEPLRLLAHVAVEDAHWSEIVRADYTLADDMLLSIWPLEAIEEGEDWRPARWTDGRPAVGVLASNGLWWRYVTSPSNANRSRAAALSDLLLCVDYLARPVSFSTTPSLADEDGTATALKTVDACVNCHSVLDPLAASLFGFYPAIQYNPLEHGYYHPERELVAEDVLGVTPAYFGTPLSGLDDLGARVASDSRFYRCTAKTMAGLLWRRDVELADHGRVESLRQAFADEDYRLRPLVRAVTDTPEYRAGGIADPQDEVTAGREVTARMLSPDQLHSLFEDLTGFSWSWQECDNLANDDIGYRVLAGGVDGEQLVRPQQDPGLTSTLVHERLAQGAAQHVVANDLGGGSCRLLCDVTAASGPEDPAFRATLATLHWRLYGAEPSESKLDEDIAFWTTLEAAHGPELAWTALLSVLFRDPAFVSY